jgi:hypothetical protein
MLIRNSSCRLAVSLLTLILFLVSSTLFAATVSELCEDVERKVYAQTLSNSDLFNWMEALKQGTDESRLKSSLSDEAAERAQNEFLQVYNYYQNKPCQYHYNKVNREEHFSWALTDLYSAYVRTIHALQGAPRDEEFEKWGLKTGQLSEKAIQPFIESLKNAPTKRFVSEDAFEGRYFVPPGYGSGYEGFINTGLQAYELGPEQMAALAPIIEELTPAITACTGSPWRIMNVLCWKTDPQALKWGMNSWHTDGKPIHVRKILIYLSGADKDRGTTEFILPDGTHQIIQGPPGTWAYAKVSEVTHRGVPPLTKTRLCLELRFLPSMEPESKPFSAGFHSFFPLVPWYDPFTDLAAK